jgi:hypothetical protein
VKCIISAVGSCSCGVIFSAAKKSKRSRRLGKTRRVIRPIRYREFTWFATAVSRIMNEEPSLADEIIMALIDGEVVDSFLV